MVERSRLEELAKKQRELKKLEHEWNKEFNPYKIDLLKRAKDVLAWKDANLGTNYFTRDDYHDCYIDELRKNCLVICLVACLDYFFDTDERYEYGYTNVHYDEIFSDNWKAPALKKYRDQQKQQKEERLKTIEDKERQEYERLKKKFGKSEC